MRRSSILLPILVAGAVTAWSQNRSDAAEARPNIIVVMADDMGFSDLGCYGGEIKTPVIDRLAQEGLRFSQFYNCALCGPSRASLMTGCYPWRVGQAPGKSIFANLTRNCATMLELLKANGYATCAVGRLDMVTTEDWHDPIQIGGCADRFLGTPSGGPGNYFREAKGSPWFKDGKKFDRLVDVLRGKQYRLSCDGREGLRSVKLICAIYESVKKGKPVRVKS